MNTVDVGGSFFIALSGAPAVAASETGGDPVASLNFELAPSRRVPVSKGARGDASIFHATP
jgi:hypothetical protein